MSTVPVATLLLTVTNSIVEVFILCLAGYVLSRVGVTDKATQRKLNIINVSLFTPALLFSKVAYSLTPSKLKEMWIIPLGFFIVTGLSAAVAWVLSKMFRLKRSQTAFAMCAAMFQNSNSLPIALIQSLVVEVPGLKWGPDDSKDQMLGRALTYLVLYSTLGMMFRWSWGVKLLSQADDEAETIKEPPLTAEPTLLNDQNQVLSPDQIPHPGSRETDPFFTTTKAMSQDEEDERRNPSRTLSRLSARAASESHSYDASAQVSAHSMHPTRRESSLSDARFRRPSSNARVRSQSQSSTHRKPLTRSESGREFWGLPQFPKRERILLEEDSSDEDIEEDDEETEDPEWGATTPVSMRRRKNASDSTTRLKAFGYKSKIWIKKSLASLNAFMTVPMYAALLSIFIAMIPPLQAAMATLKPVEQAIRSAGACSIPVTLVVLGAFFYTPPAPPQPAGNLATIPEDNEGAVVRHLRKLRNFELGNPEYPGENRAVFVAVISRMIITPLLLLPGIALLAKYDLFEAAEDPVFILAAVLLVSSPPALTLAQITQAASGDAFERLISKTISWSYAVLTPPLTLVYVVIGLVFGRL